MNDFADEMMSPSPATIQIPSQKNPQNGLELDGVVDVAVDRRVEAIRNKLDKLKKHMSCSIPQFFQALS